MQHAAGLHARRLCVDPHTEWALVQAGGEHREVFALGRSPVRPPTKHTLLLAEPARQPLLGQPGGDLVLRVRIASGCPCSTAYGAQAAKKMTHFCISMDRLSFGLAQFVFQMISKRNVAAQHEDPCSWSNLFRDSLPPPSRNGSPASIMRRTSQAQKKYGKRVGIRNRPGVRSVAPYWTRRSVRSN